MIWVDNLPVWLLNFQTFSNLSKKVINPKTLHMFMIEKHEKKIITKLRKTYNLLCLCSIIGDFQGGY
jgi:hypothetical protein